MNKIKLTHLKPLAALVLGAICLGTGVIGFSESRTSQNGDRRYQPVTTPTITETPVPTEEPTPTPTVTPVESPSITPESTITPASGSN